MTEKMRNGIRTSLRRCAGVLLFFLLIPLFASLSYADDPLKRLEEETLSYFKPLKGRVVSLDGKRVSSDLGRRSGIKRGMRLVILREGAPFLHPVTKEPIGKTETVQDRAAIHPVRGYAALMDKDQSVRLAAIHSAGMHRDARAGRTLIVTLDRPEILNAFDFRMLRELARACEDASWDDEIRVVVLTGAGRAFCVGADLKSWRGDYLGKPGEYWKWFGAFKDMHDRLREIGKPTLARVNGIAVGGGNEPHMGSTLALMVVDPFIRHVGIEHESDPTGGATQWLPIMVGDRRAREIVFLCEEIPAAQAAEWGLVNRAVPAAELDAVVDDWVEKLAAKLPQTTRYAKQQLNWWRDLSWHETVGHARDWLALSMLNDETQDAIKRFLER